MFSKADLSKTDSEVCMHAFWDDVARAAKLLFLNSPFNMHVAILLRYLTNSMTMSVSVILAN